MDLVATLVAIGFTEYEAKVYLELLDEYPATGYQLSKNSGVPRSMVYEALGRLRTRGAVLETVEERATIYRPLPPQILLETYEREQSALVKDLRSGLLERYNAQDEGRLWSISGRHQVLSYGMQMIASAKESLKLVLTDADLDTLRPSIMEANARGLEINALLTGSGELGCGQVVRHPPLESELQQLTGMSMIMADERELLIAHTTQETTATITRNHNLLFIAGQFVWMELFTQRIYGQLGSDLLARLSPEDRQIFESLGGNERGKR